MSAPQRTIDLDRLCIPPSSGWRRLPVVALIVGVVGLLLSALLGGVFGGDEQARAQLLHSWLVAFLFLLTLGLGSLFFVLVHHATKAGWGVVVRRLAENVAVTLPLLLVLFVPLWLGLEQLYHWSEAGAAAHDPVLARKSGYLNVGFFTVRALVYFACWSLLALWYLHASRRQDRTGEERLTRRMVFWSGPALFVFALTTTFAAFDWIMSLDPHWFSTMYGVYFFAGNLVGCFALLILLALALEGTGHLRGAVTLEHYHDLGKLLFAFTVFWAYIAFSQFLLIWYANIPEETTWFLHRWTGSWRPASIFLALGHFVVPFFFLMSRHIKRRRPLLVVGASWMLLLHYFDLYWQVMPNLHPEGLSPSLLDLTTLVGLGGLFVALLGFRLVRGPLVPIGDPRLAESLAFENF